MCYPDKTVDGRISGQERFQGVAEQMIARRREKQVLDALDDLTRSP